MSSSSRARRRAMHSSVSASVKWKLLSWNRWPLRTPRAPRTFSSRTDLPTNTSQRSSMLSSAVASTVSALTCFSMHSWWGPRLEQKHLIMFQCPFSTAHARASLLVHAPELPALQKRSRIASAHGSSVVFLASVSSFRATSARSASSRSCSGESGGRTVPAAAAAAAASSNALSVARQPSRSLVNVLLWTPWYRESTCPKAGGGRPRARTSSWSSLAWRSAYSPSPLVVSRRARPTRTQLR